MISGKLAALIANPALASKAHKTKAKGSDAYASQPQQAHELYGWKGQLLGTDPDPTLPVAAGPKSRWQLIPSHSSCEIGEAASVGGFLFGFIIIPSVAAMRVAKTHDKQTTKTA
jgi:hypothetical protein